MTLCVAWVRQAGDNEELVFATDSTLTGGEKWNSGIKLFELPRKDCLLCFAGSTLRAYPLILHLISSIRFNSSLQNPHTDIMGVLEYLSGLFTDLVKGVISEIPDENIHTLRGEAKFLFGGWSWKENRFRTWELYYSKEVEGFIFREQSASGRSRVTSFLGHPEPSVNQVAQAAYRRLMEEGDFDRKLDMEPLIVLRDLARDKAVREIDGSLQIAKVYRSGTSEFFGIYWPSADGFPCLQGQEFKHFDKPKVRYYDPDTFEIIEDQLPKCIVNMEDLRTLNDFAFIKNCYPDGSLKEDLNDKERDRLLTILRAHSYRVFVDSSENALLLATLQDNREE